MLNLRKKAHDWLAFVKSEYSQAIERSIEETECRNYNLQREVDVKARPVYAVIPEIIMQDSDTVSSVFNNYEGDKRTAILNFANYHHPGGGFIRGAKAQEECICHESTLYPVIAAFDALRSKSECSLGITRVKITSCKGALANWLINVLTLAWVEKGDKSGVTEALVERAKRVLEVYG